MYSCCSTGRSLIVKNAMNVVTRIHWRTLIAALGIAMVVELLLVRLYLWYLPGALAAPQNGQTNLWLWKAIRLTQQPGLGLVQSWVGVVRPGHAELIGDMFLVPVIQWLVYAVVIYLILEMYLRKSVRATTVEIKTKPLNQSDDNVSLRKLA